MSKKGYAHEDLYLLFQLDGVPPKMIVDNSKEQNLSVFKRKVAESGCHLRQAEPESLWKMAVEGGICELIRGLDRKMTKTKSPNVLWDDCLELEACILSNTDLDIFDMDKMTPETNMSVETSDITTFYEFWWYQWVYFRDTSVTFPGDKLVLKSYCGPSIDVGPALNYNILRKTGQQVHRSKYRALTPDELSNTDEIKARDEFDMDIEEKLGPAASPKDFDNDPDIVTPTPDWY